MKKTICIDPGHGGIDDGAEYDFVEEDDTNLAVALFLRCCLEKHGFEVFMTRENDVFVTLENRCDIANTIGADLFISIHCDAFHNKTVKGISTHVYRHSSKESIRIANKIQKFLINRFPDHSNRGLKKAGFHVLHHTNMPAILVECEFLSNPDTRKFLKEPENQFALANAIADAIRIYYDV